MPLAGGFLPPSDFEKERSFPLRVYFCQECSLVQILDVVPREILFTQYRYLSSVTETLRKHFLEYAKKLSQLVPKKLVVEVGCNDGVFLEPLEKFGFKAIGIEPAVNVADITRSKGFEVVNDFLNQRIALDIVKKRGKAIAVLGSNVFAHIDDMDEVLSSVKLILEENGIFSFEVHSLASLIKDLQYDMIYHEHLCYYSLIAISNLLDRYDFEIFDVENIPMHAGSLRVYAHLKDDHTHKKLKIVDEHLEIEKKLGLNSLNSLLEFSSKVRNQREKLNQVLRKLKEKHCKIAGYGAPGRGNTLLNYCGVGTNILAYIVDASPSRHNLFTPGTHIPIFHPNVFRQDPPDYALMLAWSYKDEILCKEKWFVDNGGKWIIPLPEPKIYPY